MQKLHAPHALDRRADAGEFFSRNVYDYYHLNTVEVIPENSLGKKDSRFRQGNYLICLRNVNLILILDQDDMSVLWSWGTEDLDWPHAPEMLLTGNILIYDNGTHRHFSRVIELDPLHEKVVWQYTAKPPEQFHSKWEGNAQRLQNGNTLICESRKGRVFEVTPSGKTVWEFLNPELNSRSQRKLIYRFNRITSAERLSWLKQQ